MAQIYEDPNKTTAAKRYAFKLKKSASEKEADFWVSILMQAE
jgi:hypothetical protein